jgi:cytochrome c-type biogenesis protein CcmH/NrfG
MSEKLTAAREAYDRGELDEVFRLLNNGDVNEADVETNLLLGMSYYKKQEWGHAQNCFHAVLSVEPENKNARGYIDMIQNILKFYHKDHYNP